MKKNILILVLNLAAASAASASVDEILSKNRGVFEGEYSKTGTPCGLEVKDYDNGSHTLVLHLGAQDRIMPSTQFEQSEKKRMIRYVSIGKAPPPWSVGDWIRCLMFPLHCDPSSGREPDTTFDLKYDKNEHLIGFRTDLEGNMMKCKFRE